MIRYAVSVAASAAVGSFFVLDSAYAADTPTALPKVQVAGAEDDTYVPPSESSFGPLGNQSVQDTPYSVNIVPAAVIEDQQARMLRDITKNDASVTGEVVHGTDQIYVRGFWLSTIHGNFRKDGLPIVSISNNIAPETLERVEILKGLSGFLYGFATPGGAVNYVLKRPTVKPLMDVSLGWSSSGLPYFAGDVSRRFGPNDALGLRVNAVVEDGDRPVDDTETKRTMGAASFDWRIADSTKLSLDYYQQRNRPKGDQGIFTYTAGNGVPDAPDASRLYGQTFVQYNSTDKNYGATLTHDFNEHWSASASWNRYDVKFDQESVINTLGANGAYSVAFRSDPDRGWESESWQALTHVAFDTGAVSHRVTGGFVQSDLVGHLSSFTAYQVSLGASNLSNPVRFTRPAQGTLTPQFDFFGMKQKGVLLSDTLQFGESWQLIAGAQRASLERRSNPTRIGHNLSTVTYDRSETTPNAGLVYKASPRVSLYASYAESLEQGGTAPSTAVNANDILSPLLSRQEEFGIKTSLNEQLVLTAAAFRIKKALEYIDTSNRYVQNGEQVHQGVEASVFGAVTDHLNIIGSVMLLDPEAKQTGDANIDGNRPTNVPKQQLSLFASYALPQLSQLRLTGGIYYSGSRAVDARNTGSIPSWTRVDAGVRYNASFGSGFSPIVRFNVENLFDRDYWSGAPDSNLSLGAPRTYKLTMELPIL